VARRPMFCSREAQNQRTRITEYGDGFIRIPRQLFEISSIWQGGLDVTIGEQHLLWFGLEESFSYALITPRFP